MIPRAAGRLATAFGLLAALSSQVLDAQTPAAADAGHSDVRLQEGLARGTRVEGGFAFKNLPYAAAPVGRNRWRAAQPPQPWTGVRDAATFGPACPQAAAGWNDADAARASEDCLSVNVWTPQLAPAAGTPGLPVMVWIHGGGFTGGSASNEFTDGAKLMRHGVVVVTLNYRLGVLGFLAHPALAQETPAGTSGNYGLTDQVAALQWVRDHIAAFGGDPANVTAFGQSAGGISIGWLMTSDRARGLFHRAILQSGNAFGAGMISDSRTQAEQAGRQFGSVPGLRRLPFREVIRRWQGFAARDSRARAAQPIIDGVWLREQPAHALLNGAGQAVEVLAGSNAQEFASDQPPAALQGYLRGGFGDQAAAANEYYFPAGSARAPDDLLGNAATQLVGDVMFRCGSVLASDAAPTAWLYHFEQPRPGAAVTAHSHELLYVWGNEGEWRLAQPLSAAEEALVAQMQGYWTNFARSGDPNGPGLPTWPRYRSGDTPYLAISAARTLSATHLRAPVCPLFVHHWSDPRAYEAQTPR